MQSTSLGVVTSFIFALLLVIGFIAVWGAPVFAIPIFLLAFGAFLVWRGSKQRAGRPSPPGEHVPSSAEASGDPARDSGLKDATGAGRRPAARSRA